MSCLPITPVGFRRLDSGFITPTTTIDSTNALGVGEPPYAEVVVIPSIATTTNQVVRIVQISIEETASSSGNIKKADLYLNLWTRAVSAPTTPVANTVYNPSTTNGVGVFSIAEANYLRWSDTVWIANIYPDNFTFTTGTEAIATDLHAVILSNESTPVTYAASASLRIRVVTEICV